MVTGRPTLVRRARHRLRTRVSEYPRLYLPFARHKYPGPSPEVISAETELVIDGYTRSAVRHLREVLRIDPNRLGPKGEALDLPDLEPLKGREEFERLRREPALRAWVLTAPTGSLATLGVVLDDNELVLLLERIENARIDLDTAGAAFKHRYNVIWPAQLPKYPDKPNVVQGLILGLIFALLLSIAVPATADIIRVRFLERWQVERVLDLPVLAEVQSDERA